MSDTEKFLGEHDLNKKMESILKENKLTILDIIAWLESKNYLVDENENTVS